MDNSRKEPWSAPAVLNRHSSEASKSHDFDEKESRKEPRSDPIAKVGIPATHLIDCLSDEQLTKLTRNNTKKNNGGRAGRFRSQMERVFRRLDNLAADVKLQPRYSIGALPVVNPEEEALASQSTSLDNVHSPQSGTYSQEAGAENGDAPNECQASPTTDDSDHGTEQSASDTGKSEVDDHFDMSNDDFVIEPATEISIFPDGTLSSSVTLSCLPRSVRISTSVTVLDYKPAEPVTASTVQRYDHPTRTGDCVQTRKVAAQQDQNFPKAMRRIERLRADAAMHSKMYVSGDKLGPRRVSCPRRGPRPSFVRRAPAQEKRSVSTGSIPQATLTEIERERNASTARKSQ